MKRPLGISVFWADFGQLFKLKCILIITICRHRIVGPGGCGLWVERSARFGLGPQSQPTCKRAYCLFLSLFVQVTLWYVPPVNLPQCNRKTEKGCGLFIKF